MEGVLLGGSLLAAVSVHPGAPVAMSGFNLLHLVSQGQPVKLKACGLPSGHLDAVCVCVVCFAFLMSFFNVRTRVFECPVRVCVWLMIWSLVEKPTFGITPRQLDIESSSL